MSSGGFFINGIDKKEPYKPQGSIGERGALMDNNIFREKSIERISSPEKLNDFIRVAKPSLWLVVSAIVILIIGMAIWASFGVIEIKNEDGSIEYMHPIEFVVN
jgi:hypothetical protein